MPAEAEATPVWFITAASSGFGKSIALEALKRNHHVVATARKAASLTDLASAGATVMGLDVTWPDEKVQAVFDAAVAVHGRVTHVINGAGYILEGCVEETTAEDVAAQFATNVFGVASVVRAAAGHLRERGGGVVANFGSLGSWRGGPAVSLYCSTKWAVSGLTESLAEELKPFGIEVCCIEPGYFRTGFLNAGRRISTEKTIAAYDESEAGKWRNMLDAANNKQPGDVEKGARVIVDVLTKSGAAKGRNIPLRLVLGTDCLEVIREKVNSTLELLAEWEDISASTNHDG